MSFEHWNQLVESFKADQAAKVPRQHRAGTSTESTAEGGRGRQRRPLSRPQSPPEGRDDRAHGKEGKAQGDAHKVHGDEQPGAAAAS